jgi:hypothetical protein
MKTPVMRAATAALERYQLEKQKQHRDAVAALPEGEDELPPPPRYVINDTTVEKAGELLSRCPRGALLKRDELAGWIASMEKYSNSGSGADRAFWLQAYDGGPYCIDRIRRGETYIENLSVSVLGGIQPARLAELKGLTSDGLLQRFIPLLMQPSQFPRDIPGDDQGYEALIRQLVAAPPSRVFMTDDARPVMDQARAELHTLMQTFAGQIPAVEAFVGKIGGVIGSLALILHFAADPLDGPVTEVRRATAEAARRRSAVADQFKARRQAEERRKATLASIMGVSFEQRRNEKRGEL